MKKFTTTLLWMVSATIGTAQITVDQNDMPSPGDTIRISNSIGLGGIDFEATGPNQVWDFTSLQPINQQVEEFVSVQQTPFLYQLVFLTAANLAKPFEEFDQFPGVELSDPYDFYRKNNSDFRYVGFAVTLNGIPIPNKYDNPDIIFKFPMTYGNQDSSMATFAISLPGFGYYGGWKKRVNHIDGWGTLKTPYGEFEVLKVKSDIFQYDSIYLDTLGTGIPLYREYIEYKWVGKQHGIPLCTVTDDEFFLGITYIDSVRNLITGLPEQVISEANFSLFPNPANDLLTISLPYSNEELFDISFYDVSGSLKYRMIGVGRENSVHVNLKELEIKPGLWMVRINSGNYSTTKKLIVR